MDLISRQTAIKNYQRVCRKVACNDCPFLIRVTETLTDCELERFLHYLPSAQPYTDEEIQKIQELEQAEIEKAFQLGREDALSEIIRCKDCKHYEIAWLKKDGTDNRRYKPSVCARGQYAVHRRPDWFCADAERREDG